MSTAEITHKNVDSRREPATGLTLVGRLAGALGLALALSAPVTLIVTGEAGILFWGKLGLGLALTAAYAVTNPRLWRRLAGARSTGLLAMSIASVLVALTVLGVVNYVAYRNPREFDLTREGLFTLSEQTTKVLGRLEEQVHAYAFYSGKDPDFATVEEALGRYAAASERFTFEMVDPEARPDLTERFAIQGESGPRIVLTAGAKDARAKQPTEEELTNALIAVADETSKTIYFLTGHGEAALEAGDDPAASYQMLAEALRAEGYRVEPLSLIAGDQAPQGTKVELGAGGKRRGAALPAAAPLAIPAGVSVLVIGGARTALLAPELAALEQYLAAGGRVFALVEPDSDAGLAALLKQWKVEVHDDLVVDSNPVNRVFGYGPVAPLVGPTEASAEHPALANLVSAATFFAARSLGVGAGGLPGVETQALLETGASAWGETKFMGGEAALDDADFAGPVTVATVSTLAIEAADERGAEARLVVSGDSEWVSDKALAGLAPNKNLAIDVVHWLAEEQERIAIRPRTRDASQLFLTGEQMGQLKFLAQDLLPVFILAFGIGIVLIRRQR